MAWLMTAHIVGIILWIGGFYAAASVMARRAGTPQAPAVLAELERAFLFKACHPGMLLVLLSGAGLIAYNSEYFLHEGWLHAKLAIVLFFIGLTVWLTIARRKVDAGVLSAKVISKSRWLAGAGLLAILVLALLKPF